MLPIRERLEGLLGQYNDPRDRNLMELFTEAADSEIEMPLSVGFVRSEPFPIALLYSEEALGVINQQNPEDVKKVLDDLSKKCKSGGKVRATEVRGNDEGNIGCVVIGDGEIEGDGSVNLYPVIFLSKLSPLQLEQALKILVNRGIYAPEEAVSTYKKHCMAYEQRIAAGELKELNEPGQFKYQAFLFLRNCHTFDERINRVNRVADMVRLGDPGELGFEECEDHGGALVANLVLKRPEEEDVSIELIAQAVVEKKRGWKKSLRKALNYLKDSGIITNDQGKEIVSQFAGHNFDELGVVRQQYRQPAFPQLVPLLRDLDFYQYGELVGTVDVAECAERLKYDLKLPKDGLKVESYQDGEKAQTKVVVLSETKGEDVELKRDYLASYIEYKGNEKLLPENLHPRMVRMEDGSLALVLQLNKEKISELEGELSQATGEGDEEISIDDLQSLLIFSSINGIYENLEFCKKEEDGSFSE